MSRRDPEVILRQMLDLGRKALSMARGRTREDLDGDIMLNFALVHAVEIIGEAAGRMPTDFREKWPTIPWSAVVGTRNRLIHGYDIVDLNILWDIVTNELPKINLELERILSNLRQIT